MEQVAVSELQNYSDEEFDVLMARVEGGVSLELTEEGKVVAVLAPYKWCQGVMEKIRE